MRLLSSAVLGMLRRDVAAPALLPRLNRPGTGPCGKPGPPEALGAARRVVMAEPGAIGGEARRIAAVLGLVLVLWLGLG